MCMCMCVCVSFNHRQTATHKRFSLFFFSLPFCVFTPHLLLISKYLLLLLSLPLFVYRPTTERGDYTRYFVCLYRLDEIFKI